MIQEILSQIGITPVLVMISGLLIGILHAFEPDHIAAVGTQLLHKRPQKNGIRNILTFSFTKSSLVGVFWGAGHTTAIAVIGLATYFLATTIDRMILSGFEVIVGVMLVVLGIFSVWKKFHHRHPHIHNDGHIHFESHSHSSTDHTHEHRSYVIGVIHGLAGSGTLVGLGAASMTNIQGTMSFLVLFGVGSIAGMVLVSGILGLPLLFAKRTKISSKITHYVIGSSSIAIGIGVILGQIPF